MASNKTNQVRYCDILNVIFTFNRSKYLSNMIKSHQAYASEIEMLIIDDASTDRAQKEVLQDLESSQQVEVIHAGGGSHRLGGLYMNMNMALKIAAQRGFRFLNLLQDDMQFVRPATEDISKACSTLESIENALHMSIAFRKYLDVKNMPMPCEHPLAYRSQNLQVAATGLINVDRACAAGFWFQNSEYEHSQVAIRMNFKGFVFRDPVVAFVPWPRYSRYRQLQGGVEGKNQLELIPIEPMDDKSIAILKSRGIERLPFTEEWCYPQSGFWLKPYNYTSSRSEWLKRVIRSILTKPKPMRYLPRIARPKARSLS